MTYCRLGVTVLCAVIVSVTTVSDVAIAQGAATSAIPHGRLLADVPLGFHPDSGHAYVPVHLAGLRDSVWFIVDIGAAANVVTSATVATLGAHAHSNGSAGINGLGGEGMEADNVTVDTLRVGDLAVPNASAVAFDLVTAIHLPPRPEYPVAGILGREFLRGHDLEFDFPARRLRIYEMPEPTSSTSSSLSGRGELVCAPNVVDDRGQSGEVVVVVKVGTRATRAYLDVGSPSTKLTETLATSLGVTSTSPGVRLVPGWNGGIGGEIKQYEIATIPLALAGTALRARPIRFGAITLPVASVASTDQPEMLLGLYNLNDRVLWLSFATNEVCVGPAPRTTPPGKRGKRTKASKTCTVSTGFLTTGDSRPDSVPQDAGMTVVTLTPGKGQTLAAAVKAEVQKARAQGRTPFVELGADWCAPCQELKALLEPPVDSGISDIFAGTYVIRVDIDKWDAREEKTLGLVSPRGIPAFLAIDTNGAATAIMPGDEWGDNNVSGLQPLKQFFRQHPFHETNTKTAPQKQKARTTR